jgi:hypothetical protein
MRGGTFVKTGDDGDFTGLVLQCKDMCNRVHRPQQSPIQWEDKVCNDYLYLQLEHQPLSIARASQYMRGDS